jgi:hypothetical protein
MAAAKRHRIWPKDVKEIEIWPRTIDPLRKKKRLKDAAEDDVRLIRFCFHLRVWSELPFVLCTHTFMQTFMASCQSSSKMSAKFDAILFSSGTPDCLALAVTAHQGSIAWLSGAGQEYVMGHARPGERGERENMAGQHYLLCTTDI